MSFLTIVLWFLAVLLFLILCSYLYINNVHNYWKKRGIPYVAPKPFIGSLDFIMRRSVFDFFYDLGQKNKRDYYGIFLAYKPVLVVQSPELARKILVKDFEYFQNRSIYSGESDPIGALNLFTLDNPVWSEMRQKLSPMFTSSRLKNVTELMNKNAKELVQKIQRDYVENNKPVNLKEIFSMYTSDTVASTVYGIKNSILSGQDSPLWYITNCMVKWTFSRGFEFNLIFLLPSLAALLRMKFFSQGATEYVRKIFWDVVNERKRLGDVQHKDLVNLLVQMKENMKLPAGSDPMLADNLMLAQSAIFIFGSIETSSTTLFYCLHELSHHPEAQDMLYDEIKAAHENLGKEILEYHDLLQMNYLTSCVMETLRKYAPVPYLDRVCNKTYKLDDGVVIEKGTAVFINVVGIHCNESIYPDHLQWRPERIGPISDNENLNFTFLPFGDGPHFCIGKRYGLIQVRAAVAQIIYNFKVEPAAGPYNVVTDPYSLVLSPKNGGQLKFIPRNPVS